MNKIIIVIAICLALFLWLRPSKKEPPVNTEIKKPTTPIEVFKIYNEAYLSSNYNTVLKFAAAYKVKKYKKMGRTKFIWEVRKARPYAPTLDELFIEKVKYSDDRNKAVVFVRNTSKKTYGAKGERLTVGRVNMIKENGEWKYINTYWPNDMRYKGHDKHKM